MARWQCIIPQPPVRDVEASQRWYRDTLGLGNWLWEGDFGSLGSSPLEVKPWDVREFSVRDPDGNMLRIGRAVEAQ